MFCCRFLYLTNVQSTYLKPKKQAFFFPVQFIHLSGSFVFERIDSVAVVFDSSVKFASKGVVGLKSLGAAVVSVSGATSGVSLSRGASSKFSVSPSVIGEIHQSQISCAL